MRLTTGFILTSLGISSQFACGFSLKPHNANANANHNPLHTITSLNKDRKSPLVQVLGRGTYKHTYTHTHQGLISPTATTTTTIPANSNSIAMRGGATMNAAAISGGASDGDDSTSYKVLNSVASLWAAGGVVMILGKSIKRILPIALEPFDGVASPLSTFQLGSYIAMCLWFAYVEGYKGFQLKFSPLVVARAQTLKPFQKGSPIHHTILGPFYAMGLFHATRKRKIISWSVSIGVGLIVAAVKKLPYPWRNIIDAGVIVGLSWGSLSIIIEWVKAIMLGIETKMDPALPLSDKGE
jgi:hypothetical protein